MIIPVSVPQLGEGLRQALVLRIFKDEGAKVERDELLVELETDKATMAIESPSGGVVGRWNVKTGETVLIGATMTSILTEHSV